MTVELDDVGELAAGLDEPCVTTYGNPVGCSERTCELKGEYENAGELVSEGWIASAVDDPSLATELVAPLDGWGYEPGSG